MLRLAFDCETNGLLPELTTIHCLCITNVDTKESWSCSSQYPDNHALSIKSGIKMLMDADVLIGHNIIRFDVPAIQKLYPWFKPKALLFDTLIVSRLIWPRDYLLGKDLSIRKRKENPIDIPGRHLGNHSLESWGWRLGLLKGDYSSVMKEKGLDPWAAWNQDMQDYCDLDVEVTVLLLDTIEKKEWPEESILLEIAVACIIARQEAYGFLFNVEAAEELRLKLMARQVELEGQLQDVFPPWEVDLGEFIPKRDNKTRGYKKGVPIRKKEMRTFNPNSRDHIADRLIAKYKWKPQEFTPGGKPQIDEEILTKLRYPEAGLLSEYLMLTKRIAQLADGKQAWLKAVEEDGRIHGSVNTNGAVTGRMTHSRPNMAQVPAKGAPYGEECRALFIVPKGKKLVGCDASSLELCNLAGYMGRYDGNTYIDIVLRGDKSKGTDIHSVNARALGLDPEKKYDIKGKRLTGRDIAKTWFYAFIYGSGAMNLGNILGVFANGAAVKRGKLSSATFMKNLPALGRLVAKVKNTWKKKGYLRGLDGRRLSVRKEHSALNTLLQSAGAIIMKKALVVLDEDLQAAGYVPGVNYEFVANVHDEFQIEVDEEIADNVGRMAAQAITKAGQAYNFRCPISGDYAVGDSWAETH